MLECVAKTYGVSRHPFLCNPLQLWIKNSQYVDIFQALNQVGIPINHHVYQFYPILLALKTC
jgi:hypothetical protein